MVPERNFYQLLDHRVSSSLLDPVIPSFRALSGRLEFTVRRRKFNKDSRPVTCARVPWDVKSEHDVKSGARGLKEACALIRKAFQSEKLLAMKFTTQHHLYS